MSAPGPLRLARLGLLATALLDMVPRLRRIGGYKHLPRLRAASQRELDQMSHGTDEVGEKEVA